MRNEQRAVARRSLAVVSCAVLLAGCSTLPSKSDPQALRPYDGAAASQAQGPEANRAPDLLIRDFFAASAQPTQKYQLARSYLTADASTNWNPDATVHVVDRLDVNLAQAQNNATVLSEDPSNSSNSSVENAKNASYKVRGQMVGQISAGGGYVPQNSELTETIEMQKVDGQWRISSLPNIIVIEKSELRNRYSSHNVYFFEPGGNTLVADRRWMFSGSSGLDTSLISLIMEGPTDMVAPGVLNEIPSGATFAGVTNGVYQITGVAKLNDDAQRRLAAQLVWTLALADIPGPYHFAFDGSNVAARGSASTDLTVEDFAEYNPQATVGSISSLYAIRNGQLVQVANERPAPVTGAIGQLSSLESADIATSTSTIAAVTATGEGDTKDSRLLLAGQDGAVTEILKAKTLTRPTFEYGANSMWTVLDGKTIARVSRSAGSGEIAQTAVDTSTMGDNFGNISVLRLSYTGVRAAFIIDGHVYVATVSRPNAGERKLTNVQEYLSANNLQAVSLDWQPDGSLVVGTASPDTPVWRVEQDGSSAQALPSSNIQAPVVNVAATSSAVYATDSRAALELSTSGSGSTFWREVQGLEGARSVAIVPR